MVCCVFCVGIMFYGLLECKVWDQLMYMPAIQSATRAELRMVGLLSKSREFKYVITRSRSGDLETIAHFNAFAQWNALGGWADI
jgi:hypothetical protein